MPGCVSTGLVTGIVADVWFWKCVLAGGQGAGGRACVCVADESSAMAAVRRHSLLMLHLPYGCCRAANRTGEIGLGDGGLAYLQGRERSSRMLIQWLVKEALVLG